MSDTTDARNRRRLVIAALVAVAVFLPIVGLVLFWANVTARVRDTPPPTIHPYFTTAVDIFHAYEQNEVAADREYKGELLQVTGVVKSIEKDLRGRPYVTFVIPGQARTVQAVFRSGNEHAVAQLAKGAYITVRCLSVGKVFDVVMQPCDLYH